MDWDLPGTRGLESLLVLMGAAPQLPIIILGDDPNLLQQMNLAEHGGGGKCGTVEVPASLQLRRGAGILFQRALAPK